MKVNRVDQDIDALKKQVELEKASQQLQATKMETRNKTFLSSLIGVFLKSKAILLKDSITLADLVDPPSAMKIISVSTRISAINAEICENKAKYGQRFKNVTNILGLYDFILGKLVARDVIILRLLEVIYGVFLSGYFMTFIVLIEPSLRDGISFYSGWHKVTFHFSFFILCSLASLFIYQKEQKVRIFIRQGLAHLVYQKLTNSDLYFLDNADNNLIYKLRYSEFDDYSRYLKNWLSCLPTLIVCLMFVVHLVLGTTPNRFILITFISIRILLSLVVEIFKKKSYLSYKQISFEQRKIIYEFIHSFKNFTLKNLKPRFTRITTNLRNIKLSAISRLHYISAVDRHISKLFLHLMLIYGPVRMYVDRKMGIGGLGTGVKDPHYVSAYLTYFIIIFSIELAINRFTEQTARYICYRSSKDVYGKFFDNDHVIDKAELSTTRVRPGEIILRDCDVLERDKREINDTLGFILKKSSEHYLDFHTARKTGIEGENLSPRSKEKASKKIRNFLTENFNQPQVESPGRLKLMLSRLSLEIAPGSKVCIYDNGNSSAIKAFISTLTQENYLHAGEIFMNSRISYFNPQKMNFLVGKTIRDNIVFSEEFHLQRYEAVLKHFGAQFSNYHGQDLYQVAENGLNIKTEDQRTIFLARFIYRESNIYIIDEFFKDLNLAIALSQVTDLFKVMLKDKTVLFVSRKPELIKLSTMIICFESDRIHHVVPTKTYLEHMQRAPKLPSTLKNLLNTDLGKEGRVQILQNKLKNTLFVANISFDEELLIHKKVQKQKAEIQRILANNKNGIPEILAYGVYLTQKKREEGKALDDQETIPAEEVRTIMNRLLKDIVTPKILVLLGLLHLFPMICFLVCEGLVFGMSTDFLPDGQRNAYDLNLLPVALAFFFISYVVDEFKNVCFSVFFYKLCIRTNNEIQESILDSDIRTIHNKKSHRILDKINKNLFELENNLPELVRQICRRITEVVTSVGILVYTCSFWVVPVFILVGLVYYKLLKKFLPAFSKLSSLSVFIDYKMDDLNFQLLSMIGCFRTSSNLDKLDAKHTHLLDNHLKIETAKNIDFRVVLDGFFRFLSIFTGAVSFGILICCVVFPWCNWLKVPRPLLVWSIMHIYRCLTAMDCFPTLLLDLLQMRDHYVRVEYFKKYQKKIICNEFRQSMTLRIDYTLPIVFRQVSLTLGLQPILKKLSFKVRPGSRLGIIGIDGGGRSTLFELITNVQTRDPVEKSELLVFGVKIEHIDEAVIKKDIFCLERNPTLFEGSVWENLDPYNEHDKEEVVSKLQELGLSRALHKDSNEQYDGFQTESKLFFEQKLNLFDQYSKHRSIQSMKLGKIFIPEEEFIRRGSKAGSQFELSPELMRSGRVRDNKRPATHSNLKKGRKSKDQPTGSMNEIPNPKIVKFEKVEPSSVPNKLNNIKIMKHNNTLGSKKKEPTPLEKRLSLGVKNNNSPLNTATKPSFFLSPSKLENKSKEQSSKQIELMEENNHKANPLQSANVSPLSSPKGGGQTFFEKMKPTDQKSSNLSDEDIALKILHLPPKNNTLDLCEDKRSKEGSQEAMERYLHSLASLSRAADFQEPNLEKFIASASRAMDAEISSVHDPVHPPEPEVAEEVQMRSQNSTSQFAPLTEKEADEFLSSQVGFEGKNLSKEVRQLLMVCRAFFAKPKILLTYEDCLEFGRGVAQNLQWLSKELPDSTILCITKSSDNLFFYDRVLFIDAGKILEKGNPVDLFKNEDSFLHRYLKETDHVALERLAIKLNESALQERLNKHENVNKTSIFSCEDHQGQLKEPPHPSQQNPTVELEVAQPEVKQDSSKQPTKESRDQGQYSAIANQNSFPFNAGQVDQPLKGHRVLSEAGKESNRTRRDSASDFD